MPASHQRGDRNSISPGGTWTGLTPGAQYGLAFLWTALLTSPLMAGVREICDRTALTTGTGLGELAVRHFQRAGRVILAVLLGALIVANGLNIAADLVAIGSGMQLLHAEPTWLWALVAGTLIAALLVLGSFTRIAFCVQAAVRSALVLSRRGSPGHPSVGSVLSHTLIPHIELNKAYLVLLVAVLGTTISP